MKPLFEPESVVLIGSSKITEDVGMTSPELFESIAFNLRAFDGKSFIVDVEKDDKVPEAELGIIVLPPRDSLVYAEMLGRCRAKAIVQMTGGFTQAEREEYLRILRRHGMRLLGPNTIMGIINTANNLNTTFEKGLIPEKGCVAVISQSGGVGAMLLDLAVDNDIGISKFVFMGDKLDIGDTEILRYLSDDINTKTIAMYIEGVKNGKEFIEVLRSITLKKGVVALKGGRTNESAERAMSHTASIAGIDEIYSAAFKKAGVLRVGSAEELLNASIALSKGKAMKGNKIAIVSNVGGPAILATDALVDQGLRLADFSDDVKKRIIKQFPKIDVLNPLDIIADADEERYDFVLRAVLEDENVNGVLVINMLKSCLLKAKEVRIIGEIAESSEKAMVDVACGGQDFELIKRELRDFNIPVYNTPEKGAFGLKVLYEYGKVRGKVKENSLLS